MGTIIACIIVGIICFILGIGVGGHLERQAKDKYYTKKFNAKHRKGVV